MKINFNTIHPFTPTFSKWSPSLTFYYQTSSAFLSVLKRATFLHLNILIHIIHLINLFRPASLYFLPIGRNSFLSALLFFFFTRQARWCTNQPLHFNGIQNTQFQTFSCSTEFSLNRSIIRCRFIFLKNLFTRRQ